MADIREKDEEHIIQQMKFILLKYEKKRNHEKITKKELYETLVRERVIEVNTQKAFDSLYDWAVESKLISEKGIKTFKKRKGVKAYSFTKAQIIQLFEKADRPKVAIACYMTLICGLRINEVCCLEMKDIDLENCTVYVRNSKNSRRKFDGYGKDRIIKFHSDFKPPIEKWIEIIGDSKWFLPSMTHPSNPLRKKSLHEQYRDLLVKAKLLIPEYQYEITQKNRGKLITIKVNRHKYCFHTLRHTYAQLWRDNGGDRDTLQKQLGHSDPATTQKYYDTTDDQIKSDVDKVFGNEHPAMSTTIRERPEKIASHNPSLELARLEYEKKKLELEIIREQSKTNEVKQNGEQTKGWGGEGV